MTGIAAIGAATALPPIASPIPATPTAPTAAAGATAAGAAGGGFGGVLGSMLDGVGGAQASADSLATRAATGNLTNVQDYMVAAEQANVDTQLTVAVRNNAVAAFQQIMGMQL